MGETQSRPLAGSRSQQVPVTNSPLGISSPSSPVHYLGAGIGSAILRTAAAAAAAAATTTTLKTRCDDGSATAVAPPPPPLPSASREQAPPPPAPPPSGSGSSSSSTVPDSIEAASRAVSAFTNPGPYEQAVNDCKRLVMVDTFDGFRCDINKQVSPFMAVIHSFHLGTTMIPDGRKSSYSFLTQVADEKSMLMARVDPARGSLDGRLHKALFGGLAMAKLQMGVSQDGQNDSIMAEVDVGGSTWAGNLKYGSMGGGLVYGINYMQAIHPNVSAGGEGMYIAANQNLIASYSMKFNWLARTNDSEPEATPASLPPGTPLPEVAGNSVLCMNYNTGQMAATLSYKRCVTPNRLVLGAELQFSPFSLESQVLLGAEYKWQRSKLNLCVDGGGRIQSLLEAKYGMAPGSPSLMLSAEMDHLHDVMRFGYGINIEG